jgi:hypothetical protein
MIRLLGILFLIILIEIPLLITDVYMNNGYLDLFLKNQSLSIMGTALAINIATSAFLVGQLLTIEINFKKPIFDNSKKEIKHNLIFMIIVFLLQLFFLLLTPIAEKDTSILLNSLRYICKGINLFLFLLYLYALFEMTLAIFSVGKFIKNQKE